MKHLLFLLLMPCFGKAQKFHVVESLQCKCAGYPNGILDLISSEGKMKVYLEVLDKDYPQVNDIVYFNGKHWIWRNKNLKLYQPSKWQRLNSDSTWTPPLILYKDTSKTQKIAYNKDSTISLGLIDMGNSTVEYIGCDTIKLPSIQKTSFTAYVQAIFDTCDDRQQRRPGYTLYLITPENLALIDTSKYIITPRLNKHK